MATSEIIAAVAAQPVLSGVTVLTGSEYRHQEDAPKRIVFVPMGASYEAAERHKGSNPRAIHTRVARFDAYCWDQDRDSCEALLNNLIAALRETTGDYRLIEDRAIATQGEDISNDGVVYVLSLELRVPITMPSDTSISIVSSAPVPGTSAQLIEQDVGMSFADGNTVSGTPAP